MTTETQEHAVDVPYCRICRRSSELKWRKHVFSTSHQRAAAELLAARVAKVAEARAQIADASSSDEHLRSAVYCVFCETATESKREWIQHHASPAHRNKLHAFCKYHRCDANQMIRPQLCLAQGDAQQLVKTLDDRASARARQDEETSVAPQLPVHPPKYSGGAHAQAFLESAVARLRQVSALRVESARMEVVPPDATTATASEEKASWMGPHANAFVRVRTVTSADGVQQNPLGRHEGKRVWGGGIVKLKRSDCIQWGIDLLVAAEEDRGLGDIMASTLDTTDGSDVFQHRQTDMAFGAGLSSIKRITWGDGVANIHSAAVPPWMVDTEEEYKQCNQRRSGPPAISLSTAPAESKSTRIDAPRATGCGDIFSKLAPKYDEKTWLPNFGGVWQEGSRLTTRKEFRRAQVKEPAREAHDMGAPVDFRPLRTSQVPQPTQKVDVKEALCASPPSTQPTALTTPPVENRPSQPPSVATTDLDARKKLLLAQKERLRAKLAAKRQAPT